MKNVIHYVVVLAVANSTLAQEKPEDLNAKWKEFCNLTAENISIRDKSGKPFLKQEDAIFEHKNPFHQTEHGLVYLWKQKNGRPAAIFTCLANQLGPNSWNEIIEYHSLHDDRITSSFGSERYGQNTPYQDAHNWTPKRGIEWFPLPKAPKPATSAVRLRLQSQNLVRRFNCDGYFGYRSPQQYSLRAQAKPVYTYAAKEDGKQVGGLLTFFCRATDPEAILLLEVQENDEGELAWHYALGNFTRGLIKFSLDKEEVWSNDSRPGRTWSDSNDVHYGSIPNRSFAIEDGIARQQAHLKNIQKK